MATGVLWGWKSCRHLGLACVMEVWLVGIHFKLFILYVIAPLLYLLELGWSRAGWLYYPVQLLSFYCVYLHIHFAFWNAQFLVAQHKTLNCDHSLKTTLKIQLLWFTRLFRIYALGTPALMLSALEKRICIIQFRERSNCFWCDNACLLASYSKVGSREPWTSFAFFRGTLETEHMNYSPDLMVSHSFSLPLTLCFDWAGSLHESNIVCIFCWIFHNSHKLW